MEHTHTVRISPRHVLFVLMGLITLLILADVASQYSLWFFDNDIQKLDFELEASIPSWFSSTILLVTTFLLAWIAGAKWSERNRYAVHWLGLATATLIMSADETAGLHEMCTQKVFGFLNINNHLWILLAIPFLAVSGLLYRQFFRQLPGQTRKRMLMAIGIYLGGVLVVEFIAINELIFVPFNGYNIAYGVLTLIEESMEMVGVTLFIYALLLYVGNEYGLLGIVVEDAPKTAMRNRQPASAEPSGAVKLLHREVE